MRAGVRRAADVLGPLALVAAALWCGNLWLFHGWLASGPPTPRPEWHRAWSVRFFGLMWACLALAALWTLGARRRRSRRAA